MDRDWFEFTDIGNYSNSCTFVRSSNDDKNTDPSTIQTILHVPFDSTVYLDFWGGSDHLEGVSRWIGDWAEKDTIIPTKFYNPHFGNHGGKMYGPGIVMKRDFRAGIINLMGNNGTYCCKYVSFYCVETCSQGTYYAFVCPRGKRGYC